jgi:hypothetical protein
VCVCVFVRDREAKGGVVALKPTTYISGARRHKTNLCLFSTYLQKQKGTGSHAACFTALQIAYNNNTQHQVYDIQPLQKRLRLLIRDKTGNTIHGVLECGAAHTNRKTPLNMFIASPFAKSTNHLSLSEYTLNVNNHLGVVLFFNLQKPLMCVYMCVALIRRKNTLCQREVIRWLFLFLLCARVWRRLQRICNYTQTSGEGGVWVGSRNISFSGRSRVCFTFMYMERLVGWPLSDFPPSRASLSSLI